MKRRWAQMGASRTRAAAERSVLLTCLAMASACLAVGPKGPSLFVPATHERHATGDEAESLRAQMVAKVPALVRYTCDFRLSAVGPEGRVRVLGQLLLERPDHARVTLLLPFGAPAWLGVSDGQTLAAWDIPRARIRRAPATRAGLAELSAFGDLGLTPAEAIALGWGAMMPPVHASLEHTPALGTETAAWLWRWQDGTGFERALKVSANGTVEQLELKNANGDDALITFFERGALGLPTGLRLRLTPSVASGHHDDAHVTVAELKFTDAREVPPPTANAFVLSERPNP